MAQQAALRVWTDRTHSKRVAIPDLSHLLKHEDDGPRRLHGFEFEHLTTGRATATADDLRALGPGLGAALVELPLRDAGCLLPTWEELGELSAAARELGVPLHADGARIWESQPFYDRPLAEIAEHFDSIYVSFYKGLEALAGAALAGPEDVVDEARRWRKRMGGTLFHLTPFAVSALAGLRDRLPRMGEYAAWARVAGHRAVGARAATVARAAAHQHLPGPRRGRGRRDRRAGDRVHGAREDPALRRLVGRAGPRLRDDRGRRPRRRAGARPRPGGRLVRRGHPGVTGEALDIDRALPEMHAVASRLTPIVVAAPRPGHLERPLRPARGPRPRAGARLPRRRPYRSAGPGSRARTGWSGASTRPTTAWPRRRWPGSSTTTTAPTVRTSTLDTEPHLAAALEAAGFVEEPGPWFSQHTLDLAEPRPGPRRARLRVPRRTPRRARRPRGLPPAFLVGHLEGVGSGVPAADGDAALPCCPRLGRGHGRRRDGGVLLRLARRRRPGSPSSSRSAVARSTVAAAWRARSAWPRFTPPRDLGAHHRSGPAARRRRLPRAGPGLPRHRLRARPADPHLGVRSLSAGPRASKVRRRISQGLGMTSKNRPRNSQARG